MKSLFIILIVLVTTECFGQINYSMWQDTLYKYRWAIDSIESRYVKATIIKTSEKTVVYKAAGYKNNFMSFDCKCDSLKKGDVFMIPKDRFDSLFLQAKPIRKKEIEN